MRTFARVTALSVAAALACAVAPGTAAAADALPDGVSVVVSDLVAPLHVAAGPGRTLYVADAFAGAVVEVDLKKGTASPFASGLGFSAGVDVRGKQVFVTSGDFETGRAGLLRVNPGGRVKPVADLLAYELEFNPDGQPQGPGDALSNPYAVLALPGRTLVADAAGNAVLSVAANGSVSTLTALPVSFAGECATQVNNGVEDGGCDPVPTDLALGPDGHLYVSGLGGEVEGFVWKIDLRTGAILDTWGGFPPLTGVTVAPDGTVYASSLFTDTVFRLGADGAVTGTVTVPGPTGLEAANGVVYAGSFSFTGPGSVLAIDPSAFG